MTISDYQIGNVIKTYVRNMKSRIDLREGVSCEATPEDSVVISDEGMKKVIFERIGQKMTERLRKHDQED